MKDETKLVLVLGSSLAVLGLLLHYGAKKAAAEKPLTPTQPTSPSLPLPGAVAPIGPAPAPASPAIPTPAIPTPAIPTPAIPAPAFPTFPDIPGLTVADGPFTNLAVGTVVTTNIPGTIFPLTGRYKITQADKLVPDGQLVASWRYMGENVDNPLLPAQVFWQQDIISVP